MEILELRKSLKLSRKEFCELYEIPYITVSQWEKGDRTPPAYLIKLIKENIELRTKGEQISIFEKNIELAAIATGNNGLKIKRFFENESKRDEWIKSYEKAGCKTEKMNLIKTPI